MNQRLDAPPAISQVAGFTIGTAHCGLKQNRPDLMVLRNDGPMPSCAAVFTQNQFAAAPIHISRQHLATGRARGLVVNSGLANACTGRQGLRDALAMARTTGDALGLPSDEVLVASTGIIGRTLPMDAIHQGIWDAASNPSPNEAPNAILTTDSGPKLASQTLELSGQKVTVSGFAKGSGMIHPNMATMLGFVLTDAAVEPEFLQDALAQATADSFNQISVDADPSTNDMAAVFASGSAGNSTLDAESPEAPKFVAALRSVCTGLAKGIAADGEGSTRFMEVRIEGAADAADARVASRAVASSFLVKAALHGADANWGRILAAIGSTDAAMDPDGVSVRVTSGNGECTVLRDGQPVPGDTANAMQAPAVTIHIDLASGDAVGQAWGCDISPESVSFNAEKTT